METVGPALEVCKCISGPVSRRMGYMYNLNKNFEELNSKVDRLHARMEDVNKKISVKKATSECANWLTKVDKIQNKWKEIEAEYRNNMTCLGGWCPNLSSRFNLGKRIVALIDEADASIEQSNFKEDIVVDEPQQIMEISAPGMLEGSSAAEQTLQELLSMIKEATINRIGLWGMGGVGKTTIMKVLHNHQEIVQMFEMIIWVTVSKEGTNRNVQEELAQRLNVKRQDGESDHSFKSKVFMGLRTKKFLLLLDDVWDMIDLEAVGVPLLDEGNTGCKVVLSSRSLLVCHKMRTNKEIQVQTLSDDEAWSLFRREVGEVADDSRIQDLARKVAMECCGLPLATVVVAGALRKEEDIHVWRYALKELSSAGEIEDMEEKVYGRLKYSYDRLKGERSKECFLYCALFPEDFEIPKAELIRYWVNEGLIDGWSNLEEAEDEGFSKLKELMDASLLEKGTSKNSVKMHDVMRDLALRISSVSLVKAGVKLSEAPKVEDWEKAKKISLMNNYLEILPPIPPNCRLLTTLLLQQNLRLSKIPPDFFAHMSALKVLDLSLTGIKSLPPSIGSLANLQGLYLNDCEFLKAICKEVGALLKLEIFEMKGGTEVCYLPPEIEDLASLKHFDVKCGPSMEMFPRMSKLSMLDRLCIHVENPIAAEWWAMYHSEGVSQEISMLNKLNHLLIRFSKIEHFEYFVQQSSSSWKQLITFRILIDQDDSAPNFFFLDWDAFHYFPQQPSEGIWHSFEAEQRRVVIYNDGTKKTLSDDILTSVDCLTIGDRVAFQRLSEFGLEKMKELKYCSVVGSQYIETMMVIDFDDEDGSNGKQNSDLFPNLEVLYLEDLPNLKGIWEWEGPSPSPPLRRKCFPSLTCLSFFRCPKLKRAFSRGLIPHLSNLETLNVRNCSKVEEIFSMQEEEGGEEKILLPRLMTLRLIDLPKLTRICSNTELSSAAAAGWPSLVRIFIDGCENLKRLPRSFSKASNLQNIECNARWWETLEWEDDAFKRQLCSKVRK